MVEVLAEALWLKNDPLALFPMELPSTGPTRVQVTTVRLVQARRAERILEVLAEALWLKNDPLALFPTKVSLTGPTGLSVGMVGLGGQGLERMVEV